MKCGSWVSKSAGAGAGAGNEQAYILHFTFMAFLRTLLSSK